MQGVKRIVWTAVFFFVMAGAGYAADVAKIGVLDIQKILTSSSAGKKAKLEINKRGKAMETELKEKEANIKKQRESFERESLVMSRSMREQKERDIRIMINDLKSMQKRYMAEFKEYERRIVSRIRDDVFALVAEKAKKEGYLLVIEKREGGLLYYPNSLDITDEIITVYNAQFGEQSASEASTDTQ